MTTGSGARLAFRRDGQSARFVLATDEPIPHQAFHLTEADSISEEAGGLMRTYRRIGDLFRLSRIADPNGNAINISFDALGNIAQLSGAGGGSLTLEWSETGDPRLLGVSDHTGRRIAFRQDGQRLRAVTDAASAQWSYDYQSGRLTRAADPMGRALLRVRYDGGNGRVTEAGDAAGAYLYEYQPASAPISRRTTITDPLGARTIFKHTGRGALAAMSDDEGQTVSFEYNEANRPVRIANSLGDETRFAYDSQHRLLSQTGSDGATQTYVYDERGRIAAATVNGVRTDYARDARGNITAAENEQARGYRTTLNERGQVTALRSGEREISFEYDANGQETAYTYAGVGRFSFARDAAGRIITERFPSGLTFANEYDARGQLARRSNSLGSSVTIERDMSGAPIAFVRTDGRRARATRDAAGRVVAVTGFDNRTRRFAYDARGALTAYTDERGRTRRYDYDRRGRLQTISEADGTRRTLERDARGRALRLTAATGPQAKPATRLTEARAEVAQ